MILKQRHTVLDPFLLHVVFPTFHVTHLSWLSRTAGLWHYPVAAPEPTLPANLAEPLWSSAMETLQGA